MKLIRTIKNTVIDSIINEGKIPNGVKRRLRKMEPKEVVQEINEFVNNYAKKNGYLFSVAIFFNKTKTPPNENFKI